jgi:hypothetical protein
MNKCLYLYLCAVLKNENDMDILVRKPTDTQIAAMKSKPV